MLAHRPIHELSLTDYHLLPETFRTWLVCIHCGCDYMELENIGQLHCRLHPGIRTYNGSQVYYTCCETNSDGCCAADHQTKPLSSKKHKRETQIRELAVDVLPQVCYWFGLELPEKRLILMRIDSKLALDRTMPVRVKQARAQSLVYTGQELSDRVEKESRAFETFTQMERLLTPEKEARRKTSLLIDERWRTNLVSKTASNTKEENFIPFIVIQRIMLK